MTSPIAPGIIHARELTLDYPIYTNLVADRMRAALGIVFEFLRPPSRRVLNGISFDINPGEVVGFIGRNGAGKTSLLKVISGLVAPTSGSVTVGGRIMALLTMGVGFKPMLTGRENIEYGGLLLGMNRREITSRMDAIFAFSELAEAFEQPYFTYSAGMRARLAFSLATHVPADIVILDETLATGDVRFAGKCYRRMAEMRSAGTTILFVSHNLGEVARVARRVILIEAGSMHFDGSALAAIEAYDAVLAALSSQSSMQVPGLRDMRVALTIRGPNQDDKNLITIGRAANIRLEIQARQACDVFVLLRIVELASGRVAAYLTSDRWQALRSGAGLGVSAIVARVGKTTIDWDFDAWVLGEGEYGVDVYVGPAVEGDMLDYSFGRFWLSAGRFWANISSTKIRGANTMAELPVAAVNVTYQDLETVEFDVSNG